MAAVEEVFEVDVVAIEAEVVDSVEVLEAAVVETVEVFVADEVEIVEEEEDSVEDVVVGDFVEGVVVVLEAARRQLWNHIGMKVCTLQEVLKMHY